MFKTSLIATVLGALALVLSAGFGSAGAVPPAAQRAASNVPSASTDAPESLPAPIATETPHAGTKTHGTFQAMTVQQLARLGAIPPVKGPFFRGRLRPLATATTAVGSTTLRTGSIATASSSSALYSGLNKPGISAANNSQGLAPPDSTGAIGPNDYVEMANSIVHVWDRSLNSVSSAPFQTFTGLSDPFCDPQIQWDPAAERWLYVILMCDTKATTQFFVFGWSKTADPSNLRSGWCTFGIQTGSDIFDFPKLGHNTGWMIIGGNFFDITSPQFPFVTAAIAWIQLPPNGSSTCPSSITFNHTNGTLFNGTSGFRTFTPVPVNTDSSASDGYILSAYDVSSPQSSQNRLAVWHLDSSGTLHADPDIAVNTFAAPPPAPQLGGGADTLDTLEGQLTQAVGDPVTGIWTQHTVSGGAGSKVTWYELALSGSTLVKVQEGDITSATDYVFNAAISPSLGGHGAAVFYNRSSSTIDPVIAARVRASSTPLGTMASGELVLATSPAPDTDFSCLPKYLGPPCRWGDYSAASPDPVQPYVVWGTNEFNTASTGGQAPAWQDENFAVAAAVPPGAPTNVTASASGFLACVSWTPSTLDDGGAPDLSYTIKTYQGGTVVKTQTVTAPATSGCLSGLARGVTYTFTVTATNIAGSSPESLPSAPLTFGGAVAQSSPSPVPTRSPIAQSSPEPPPSPRP